MSTWINDDGLKVKFGTNKTQGSVGGESSTEGFNRVVTVPFTWEDLEAFGSESVLEDGVYLPDGAFVKSAELVVTEAFTSGGAATLSLGFIDSDESTVVDADGIDANLSLANLSAGSIIECDGAAIGAALDNGGTPVKLSSTVGTADFTGGEAVLTLTYFIK